MSLLETIQKDSIEALKAGETVRVEILKLLIAALKNARISKNADLTAEEEVKTVFAEAKKLKDAIEQYKKGGREDLANHEAEQLKFVEKYLPAQADAGDVEEVVSDAIKELGASGPQEIGKVMGFVMKKLQGKADGAVVNEIVRKKLSQDAK